MIGPWIAETQARKVTAQAEICTATGRRQMSRDDIAAIVAALTDLAQVVREADPADKGRPIRPAQPDSHLPARPATGGGHR